MRYPRRVPKDEEAAKELARRTLTNLYDKPPAWLTEAHRQLDEAVFAAYGWPTTLTEEDILARLLDLNLCRAPATNERTAGSAGAEESEGADDA